MQSQPLPRHVLLVNDVVPITDGMVNTMTHCIRYNVTDSLSVLESKVNDFAKDGRPIDSVGFVFHGSYREQPLASDCSFFNTTTLDQGTEPMDLGTFGSILKITDLIPKIKLEDDPKLTLILKNLVDNNGLKNIDFLACNLASFEYWKQYFDILGSKLGQVEIGGSLDKTGNPSLGGDWLLEISGRDSKTIYFNDNITELKILFASPVDYEATSGTPADAAFFNNATGLSGSSGYTLTSDVTITIKTNTGYSPIVLNTTGTFNGAGKTVTIVLDGGYSGSSPYLFPGLFTITSGTVNNLAIIVEPTQFNNIKLANLSGWINSPPINIGADPPIITPNSCTITNCSSSGLIFGQISGGIVGPASGYNGICTIKNCTSFGDIFGAFAGGIVGAGAGSTGKCVITNCTSSGNISGVEAGGIAASFVGSSSGDCEITNCTSSGNMSGTGTGGITGSLCGYRNGNCEITNCTSSGNISSGNAGGIVGFNAGTTSGICTINKCMATGILTSGNLTIGSIAGANNTFAGSGTLNIDDCYYTVRLAGSGSTVTTTIANHESKSDNANMKGIVLYSMYPVLTDEYYNIHGMGIEETTLDLGLQIVKLGMTEDNMHPMPNPPVPDNMEIAYGTNAGKVGTILKFTLTSLPNPGTKARFCIPNADTTKTFGVYDINDVQIGTDIVNDVSGSNTFNFVFTYPSGYTGTPVDGPYVFFVRNLDITNGGGGGDPHIRTISGEKYLLDNKAEIVNLFTDKKNDISIHGYCGMLSNKDFKYQIYCINKYYSKTTLSHLFSYTYFRKFVVRSGDQVMEVDADTLRVTKVTNQISEDQNVNNIAYNYINGNGLFSISNNVYYPKTNDTKMIELWVNKKIQLLISSDVNTDERHFLKLSVYDQENTRTETDVNADNLTGAMIKNDPNNIIKWKDTVKKPVVHRNYHIPNHWFNSRR